uniref:Chromate transporter n=1 Tax=Alexandrium catenella TaxID=2925 RepID=A0A7S1QTA4_ALECA
MANCLPGPSSTQVAFAIGITQQGVKGGLTSGLMFLLPGLFLMTGIGFGFHLIKDQVDTPRSAANSVAIACSAVGVALVFGAVTGLVKKVVQGKLLGAICFTSAAACVITSPQPAWLNPALILLGGAICAVFPPTKDGQEQSTPPAGKTGLSTAAAVAIFVIYILGAAWTLYDSAVDHGWLIPFLTAGMFVWGGGPVVLPMLMTVLTPTWISHPIFLTGIAIAEMMPGPVFNMSAFLGVQLALANGFPWPAGTLLAWAGLMGPGIVLTFGAMPLWVQLRNFKVYSHALPGLNAAAVGLLVSTIFTVFDALEARSPWPAGSRAIALCSYAAIEFAKADVPVVVLVAGLAGLIWSLTQQG